MEAVIFIGIQAVGNLKVSVPKQVIEQAPGADSP